MVKFSSEDLFDLKRSIASNMLVGREYPWTILPMLGMEILELGNRLKKSEYEQADENIWISRDARIASTTCIAGPLIIDHEAELRQGAFVRGNVVIGKQTVVGNSVELKNCILFDQVQVPHFNYVGDSILGWKAHLGAGTVTSNVRLDKKNVIVHADSELETGLRKMGAIIGDRVEIGCNSVLNPGVIISRDCIIYPTACVRGCVPPNSIVKADGRIISRKEH